MRILSVKEEDLCTYTGIFGCLISAVSIIQHIVCYRVFDFVLPAVMLAFYLLSFISFVALAMQKSFAPILLLVSSSLCLFNAAMALRGPLLSPLIILHFVYSATLVVVIYMDKLPARLRAKELAIRAERNEWIDKI
ncbi:MAG: hypothetical protein EOO05_05580 [Chitinophagaceae bacterium]|nr:MAG: hypothetical protein EOO05_05580 [Chitinophagaceae bacterium]